MERSFSEKPYKVIKPFSLSRTQLGFKLIVRAYTILHNCCVQESFTLLIFCCRLIDEALAEKK